VNAGYNKSRNRRDEEADRLHALEGSMATNDIGELVDVLPGSKAVACY